MYVNRVKLVEYRFQKGNASFFIGSSGVSAFEKQIILDVHNRMRQSVALGYISGQPPAANMMEMVKSLPMALH